MDVSDASSAAAQDLELPIMPDTTEAKSGAASPATPADTITRVEEMHPDMARLWRWHALEEAEHEAVAYDVMEVAKIPRWVQNVTMVLNTFGLALETWERMIYMMWKDGRLFEVKTWMSGMGFLLGKGGFLRGTWSEYSAWYRADFHPNDIDDREMITQLAPVITAEIA